MGNSIMYFVDTDLPTNDPDKFLQTLNKRIGKPVILCENESFPSASNPREDHYGEWCLCCGEKDLASAIKETDGGLTLLKYSPEIDIFLDFHGKVFWVDAEYKDFRNNVAFTRFNLFCNYLSEHTEQTLKELKCQIDFLNNELRPIIGCSRLFMCGDTVYSDDAEEWDTYFYYGCSIDEVLDKNRQSKNPEPIYTWDNLDILMKDYVGWGLFDFDLTKLPDYMNFD